MLISIQVAKDPLRFSRHAPKVYHSGNWLASQLPLSIQELPLDPTAFRPPQKKRNGCDIANVIIFRQLTKQTEYIVTTCYNRKAKPQAQRPLPEFPISAVMEIRQPLSPFNKYDTSKTESGTPQHRHSNTPECPRPEDCRQTRPLRNQYRTLC